VLLLVLLLLWSLPRWLVKRQAENRGVFTVDILMCTSIFMNQHFSGWLVVLLLLWSLPRWLVKRQPENRGVFIVDILMCTSIFLWVNIFLVALYSGSQPENLHKLLDWHEFQEFLQRWSKTVTHYPI
jgi:predicted permease